MSDTHAQHVDNPEKIQQTVPPGETPGQAGAATDTGGGAGAGGNTGANTGAGINTGTATPPLTRPEVLALFSLMAGPLVAGPMAGSILAASGRPGRGRALALSGAFAGCALFAFLFMWPMKWYWASLLLAAVHAAWAAFTFVAMRHLHARCPQRYHFGFEPRRRQARSYLLAGMISGSLITGLLGGVATILFLLGTDRLFYTLMPVASENYQAMIFLVLNMFSLCIAGAVCGGYLGKNKIKIEPLAMLGLGLVLIWVAFSWLFALQVTIALPGYLAGQASDVEGTAVFFPFLTGNLLIGLWWIPFLFIYVLQAARPAVKARRLALVPLVNFSAALTLVVLFGYPAKIYHAAGRYLEKQALIEHALTCYERGLKMDPADNSTAYLQYRMALLAHKMGNDDQAIKGFRKVVAKYTSEEELVEKSSRFLDRLTHAEGPGKRIALPGVETRTAHKGAYCVPNSMALVMRFWGAPITALDIGREITGLGGGTTVVDQAWYARQHDFRHDFLPMATIEDVKKCIDAGFPVMVYVPAHVFVIVGYDELLETFITYDVATRDVWVDYLQKDFVKSWKRQVNTMVLAYPDSASGRIPAEIRERLVATSDEYLHYHLNFMSSLSKAASSRHLFKAAEARQGFFLPLTILFNDYPGVRPQIAQKYDTDTLAGAILDYFRHDFDEGTHLWGQMHYDEYANEDPIFGYSLRYLVQNNKLAEARELIAHIRENGVISDETRDMEGLLDLALDDLAGGVNILSDSYDDEVVFYLALANLKLGNRQVAVKQLIETVEGCTCSFHRDPVGPRGETRVPEETPSWFSARRRDKSHSDEHNPMGFDGLGFPAMTIANNILLQQADYGDTVKELEEGWFEWLHHDPFDAEVAAGLAGLYAARLERLEYERDWEERRNLERKRAFALAKAEKYRIDQFFGEM